jgi:hypothetical protein
VLQPGDVVIRWEGDEVSFDQPWERDLFEYLKNTLPAEFAIGNLPSSVRHELNGADEQNTARALAVILVQTQFLAGRRRGEITQSVFEQWMAAFLTDRMLTTDPQLLDEDDPGAGFVLSLSPNSKRPFQMATALNAWIGAGFPAELDLPKAEGRDDRWLRIEDIGEFLSWVPSPSGRFRVAWRDG